LIIARYRVVWALDLASALPVSRDLLSDWMDVCRLRYHEV
jgi:hypothetical protein